MNLDSVLTRFQVSAPYSVPAIIANSIAGIKSNSMLGFSADSVSGFSSYLASGLSSDSVPSYSADLVSMFGTDLVPGIKSDSLASRCLYLGIKFYLVAGIKYYSAWIQFRMTPRFSGDSVPGLSADLVPGFSLDMVPRRLSAVSVAGIESNSTYTQHRFDFLASNLVEPRINANLVRIFIANSVPGMKSD